VPGRIFHAASNHSLDGGDCVDVSGGEDAGRVPVSPSWEQAGWLTHNPLGVPTEREVHSEERGLPTYRIMLEKIS
jgi:hypothetical protein